MSKKDAYITSEMQLQNHSLAFIHKNKSLVSATSILSRSPMAYNTTATLDELTCTDYVDFGKCQDKFERVFWSKKDSKFLDIKLKEVFKRKDQDEKIRLRQNVSMEKADFIQFVRQRNQLVVAADTFLSEQN